MIHKMMIIGCLAFLMLTAAMWYVSRIWSIEWDVLRSSAGRRVTVTQVRGHIHIKNHEYWPPRYMVMEGDRLKITAVSHIRKPPPISLMAEVALEEKPSFDWSDFHHSYGPAFSRGWTCTFPHWLLILLFGFYPAFAFIRSPYCRRHLRRKKGLCLKCGYNLTGNVSGVCPECGERI
jgi:hypothetical protein